nr:epsin-1 isoform X3 [Bactrocera oleae]XP_036222753.1 epsin-1 isoform X1 [Bactrocera oleae]XP_036222755.1 epsin-1 isoform X1 [Bactrocera oleae]XP_036222763.1 epsin-1 isoform X1 [Bactrocera oleae]XP_036222765.1 epsin-1 isoform X1 [Bactrocera oleae]XP_036222769.1 epsin-1 isoform X1 [Bactrocera oleae]XP_036222776.1 epsin-1 isoform X1 [Bactrocera oleae]XP_036222785.1 epsin-1 isoform X1 [Bactrocera oleae]XP_036222794.1 epsin-1 isoform X1 [Bactrocera oleae]XP_036222797.1 epsin-1 isoform X2 [Bac
MRKQKEDMQVNVAGLRRNIKNLAHNYSDAQVKVREATSNDSWGPSATIMAEIADLTYNVVAFSEIMQMIWKRLNDHGKNWRHVYKALILLDYLIKTGTEKVAQQCKENIFAIQTLREFVYFEEGKDQGTHVREKAKQLVNLLKDDERLKNERVKALKAKERFAQHPSGFGSDGYIDGPTHRDMPPGWQEEPKPVSELELVRPQTAGEEELQLQLAMAMSREEAEQEEAKRRSDDVRLQLALSQSEQDFKDQTVPAAAPKKEEQQSHLLDLLDISLGATSISSPPLGATGGSGDPWGTPARAASQLSDPWSGTSSPQIDPWQPAAAMRTAIAPAPLGAVGGIGSNGDDAWGLTRTQSPSVASGSSTEGWLHSNGGGAGIAGAAGSAAILNGNSIGGGAIVGLDPWLSKAGALGGAAAAEKVEPTDPWLTESVKPVAMAPLAAAPNVDPWAPKAGATSDDPWKSNQTNVVKKPSPDLDEFDIITNRNKTGDLLTNSLTSASNNNNASLLDEMDPLSATNSSLNASSTNTNKQLKTPQSFLGENSSLVNLDNLIKPVQTQSQAGNAAYNPFSDTVIPPKTNLFQQQQPAVPSINQLKQQQPFAMTMNQDPWAPVANATNASQPSRNFFTDYDSDDFTSLNSSSEQCHNDILNNSNNSNNKQANNNYNNNNKPAMQYSKSDYDVFNSSFVSSSDFFIYPNNNNRNNNINKSQQDGPYQFQTQVQIHSQSVDNIRNMQIASDSDTELHDKTLRSFEANGNNNTLRLQPTPAPTTSQFAPFADFSNTIKPDFPSVSSNFINNNNNNPLSHYAFGQPSVGSANAKYATASLTSSYSNALTAALADTPGIKIAPVSMLPTSATTMQTTFVNTDDFGNSFDNNSGAGGVGGGSLFNYGFFDANSSMNHNNNFVHNLDNNAIFSTSTLSSSSLGNCKLENNNNMPWMNPEAASSSNPFLS